MRIALVSREYPPFYGGGIGTYAAHMAPSFARAGHPTHVVTAAHDESIPRVTTDGSLTVHRTPFEPRGGGWSAAILRFAAAAARIVATLAEQGLVEVVEFAECEAAGAFLTTLSGALPRTARIPTIIHFHSPTEQLLALRSLGDAELNAPLSAQILAERAAILNASARCAPSRYLSEQTQRHYDLPQPPLVIPHPFLDPPAPLPPTDARRVLYLGRMEPRKGVESLIHAWIRVAGARPDWTLRLVGGDTATAPAGASFRERLQRLISSDVRDSFEFIDNQPPAELRRMFAEASFCVIPSLWENFPFTCMESMAHSRPVVVSSEGGMAEMLEGTRAGLVFPAGDEEALADALVQLIDEAPDRRAERGREARERIISMCDPQRIVARRVEFYRCAAQSTQRRGAAQRLELWRTTQRALTGDLDAIQLPPIADGAERWIHEALRP